MAAGLGTVEGTGDVEAAGRHSKWSRDRSLEQGRIRSFAASGRKAVPCNRMAMPSHRKVVASERKAAPCSRQASASDRKGAPSGTEGDGLGWEGPLFRSEARAFRLISIFSGSFGRVWQKLLVSNQKVRPFTLTCNRPARPPRDRSSSRFVRWFLSTAFGVRALTPEPERTKNRETRKDERNPS